VTYTILAGGDITDAAYKPMGGCAEFIYCKEHEYIAAGPAETGKTLAACWKIHMLSLKYPGLNGAVIRKTQKSLYGSVLQTWERVIKDAPVSPYGGEKPEKYIYDNGSVIWVGGMDNSDKVLSSERDFFYVNQAEELSLDDWEKLTTRTTGRGAVMPYTMTFGDCNPAGSKHWIRQRAQAGSLKIINTSHRDNPTIFDAQGNLTERGKRSLGALQSLTGVRRKRLYEGIWATAEGAVFDMFDAAIHVKVQDIGNYKNFRLAMDEGYTNPAVILVIGEDNDGRRHVFKEFYERGKLQSEVVSIAVGMARDYNTTRGTCDAAAAGKQLPQKRVKPRHLCAFFFATYQFSRYHTHVLTHEYSVLWYAFQVAARVESLYKRLTPFQVFKPFVSIFNSFFGLVGHSVTCKSESVGRAPPVCTLDCAALSISPDSRLGYGLRRGSICFRIASSKGNKYLYFGGLSTFIAPSGTRQRVPPKFEPV